MRKQIQQVPFPVLLVELDTPGVERGDWPIQVVCKLVDQMESGPPQVIDSFVGQQEGNRPRYGLNNLPNRRDLAA